MGLELFIWPVLVQEFALNWLEHLGMRDEEQVGLAGHGEELVVGDL
jgi:hypothetical protein